MYRARLGRERPRRRRGGGPAGQAKSLMTRFAATGSRRCGPWPEPSNVISRAPGMAAATAAPRAGPTTASAEPWMTSVGQRIWAQSRSAVSAVVQPVRVHASDDDLRVGVQAPADRVLDLLGRVRLGERLGEEEVEEPGPVPQPVVPVPLGPAFRSSRFLIELVRAFLLARLRGQLQVGRDQQQTADPLRVLGGQEQVSHRRRTRTRRPPALRPRDPAPPGRRRRWPAGRRRAHFAGAGPSARSRAGRT